MSNNSVHPDWMYTPGHVTDGMLCGWLECDIIPDCAIGTNDGLENTALTVVSRFFSSVVSIGGASIDICPLLEYYEGELTTWGERPLFWTGLSIRIR